ncbi:hypothetical protein KFE96_17925 [Kordiimonas sp. SCSIO 12603]|uniref:hypothetical protein n=1 Tax=Kordiimonas sp. SCSIO 12603 TaxID=2829596 RepID=UPI0021050C9E|nr:hypothetical protein [Kordiimonas sp. SCSIO 12603]UTW58670.1 hypothetical protein KFE96_17925 [Kordiimonas sp. SCSIO 12603]
MLLGACSSTSGDWPSLAEPLPDTAEHERVIERAEPTNTRPQEEKSPLTTSTAIKLFDSTEAKLKNILTDYLNTKNRIESATGDNKLIEWRDAQLKLTRYSNMLSKFDAIVDSPSLMKTGIWKKAFETKQALDVFIIGEREALAAMQP